MKRREIAKLNESARKMLFYPFALLLVLVGALASEPGTMLPLIITGIACFAFGLVGEKLFLGLRLEFNGKPPARFLAD